MPDLSVGEGRASEAFRVVAAITDPAVEVGRYHNGFYGEIAQDCEAE